MTSASKGDVYLHLQTERMIEPRSQHQALRYISVVCFLSLNIPTEAKD